ncbi:heterokaryon incompatibility protein-domain-containing protein [Lasiosphaeria miniovina]|uniref:Heterokaryon incompatibility protein-domain-containing protein n=1 Tax=Lasiosphaeria miniovina TaxID=1954250 RepID=A0AA40AC20_9PEZI|nr:heterokaryon incompatibility protein-domain-containing protein [Lasiosphaeria miniovina]KAK0712918.1 heterokaryon incompatibility protein-domain-containing protein [Lasiosphaeria miniovina]
MGFCEYCAKIPSKLFSFRRDEQCTYDHQPSLSALQDSATAGCNGCRLVLHAIASSGSEHAGKYVLARTWSPDEQVRLSSTKFGWQVVRVGWKEAGHFRTFAVPAEWNSEEAASGPGAGDQDSAAHLLHESRLIRRWSELCLAHHTDCGTATPFLPTRLIDVGTAARPELRLVLGADMADKNARYLALSHCWGRTMPAAGRTTAQTLARHRAAIAPGTLPRTFRDFVAIARRVAARYVWIDSLCIVQDSREDWEREATQMAAVYSHAHFTVSASGSADGRGGCRVVDDVRSFGPVDLLCRVDGEGAVAEKTFRLWSRDTFPVGQVLSSDPLTARGWCLQERELSPRVVHFSKDTVRWECRGLRASLEFPWGDAASFDVGRLLDGGSAARPTALGMPINDSTPLDDATRQRLAWFELVDRYTSRALTHQVDILPAFSGIARTIANSTADEYCAGLWRSYFAHCLLWASNWHVGRGLAQHSRPPTYLAPTWSWASVKGPVHYLSWVNGYYHTFNAQPDPAYVPRLVDVALQTSADRYGVLLPTGSATLAGKVRMAYTRQELYAVPQDASNTIFSPGAQDRLTLYGPTATGRSGKVGEIRYDVPLCTDCAPVGTIRVVWLLCCMNSKPSPDGSVRTFAIALQGERTGAGAGLQEQFPTHVPARFQRVGVAWGIDSAFWQGAFIIPVTII